MSKTTAPLYKKGKALLPRLTTPALVLAALITPCLIIISVNSPAQKNSGFQKNIIGSGYSAKVNSLNTHLASSPSRASVSVSRGSSTLRFDTPLENSKLIKRNDSLIYTIPDNNIELHYQLTDTGLKEDIVLFKPVSSSLLQSSLSLKNLEINISPEGIPVFLDTKGNYQFHFERPYAVDAAGNTTYALRYYLRDQNKNVSPVSHTENKETYALRHLFGKLNPLPSKNYTLILEIDPDWLFSASRQYPIRIDPTVVHNSQTEFSSGVLNRVSDTGTGETSPQLESYYQEYPLVNSTVSLWHFNENSGDILEDNSPHGNNGTVYNSDITDGIVGNGRSFNGASSYIAVPHHPLLSPPFLSLAAWIKPNSYHTGTILTNGDNTGYRLRLMADGRFSFSDGSNNYYSSTTYTLGNWHHIAVSANMSGISIYINGLLDSFSPTGFGGAQATTGLYLGRSPSYGEYLNAVLDEVAVYDQSLSEQEIKLLAQRSPYATYTSPVIDLDNVSSWNSLAWTSTGESTGNGETLADVTNLIAQYNFNHSSGTTAVSTAGTCDSSCNFTAAGIPNLSGQDIGGTGSQSGWTALNSLWGNGAFMFDGTDDYLTIPSSLPAFKSMEFWIFPNNVSSISLLQLNTNITITTNSAGKVILNGFASPQLWVNGSSTNLNLIPGTWNYIVVTGDYDVTVGTGYIGRVGSSYFKGIIDSARFYSRSLTVSEIARNLNRSKIEFLTRSSPDSITWDTWSGQVGNTQVLNFDSASTLITASSGQHNYPPPISVSNTGQTAPAPPSGCSQYQLILLNNIGNGNTLSNAAVETLVPYSSGMLSDFSNIRFTSASGIGLSYYLNDYSASKYGRFYVNYNFAAAYTTAPFYLWYNGCNAAPTSNGANTFADLYNDFTGTTINTSVVTVTANVTQNSWLILQNDNNAWDVGAYSTTIFPRLPGRTFQALLRPHARSIIGWKDNGSNVSSSNMVYGIYFSDTGNLEIREDGNTRNSNVGTFAWGYDYDVKIVLKDRGADYYYKSTSSSIWKKIYDSSYSTETNLRPAVVHYDSSLPTYTDNWKMSYESALTQITTNPLASLKTEGSGALHLDTTTYYPDRNTLALLHFNETGSGIGTTFYDSSVNGNYAVGSSTSYPVSGFSGQGRQFSSGSFATLNIPSGRPIDNFTVETWFNTDSSHEIDTESTSGTAGSSGQKYLFYPQLNAGIGSSLSAGMGISVGTNGISVYEQSDSYFPALAVYNGRVPTGWNHLAVTYTNKQPKIYLNGTLVRTGRTSSKIVYAPLHIGGGGSSGYFTGMVDEVKIINIPLNPEEIKSSFRAGKNYHFNYTIAPANLQNQKYLSFNIASDQLGPALTLTIGESASSNNEPASDTLALYHLDEFSKSDENILRDSSSFFNNIVISGTSAPSPNIGRIAFSRHFDGDDFVNLGNPSQLQSINNQTISLWLKPDDITQRRNPFCKAYGGEFCIVQELSGNLNYFYGTSGANTTPYQGINTNAPLNLHQWNHAVIVRDLTNMKLRWYLNGRLVNEMPASYSVAKAGTLNAYIGDGYVYNYMGDLDEVMISNRAYTTSEIQQLYHTGLNSHQVTIDFKAKLDGSNLLIGSTDYSFNIDETPFGSPAKASHLNRYDQIIIQEKIGETMFSAQGEVSTINRSLGTVTVSSWNSSSTFPPAGFTTGASVYKWQTEYIDLTTIKPENRNAVTNLNFIIQSQGANILLDDLRTYSGFMNLSSGSTIPSTPRRYFQYKAIYTSQSPSAASASLNSVTLNYQGAPSIPLVDNSYLHDHIKTNTSTPQLRFSSSGNITDNLTYELQFGLDPNFSTPSTRNSNSTIGFTNTTTPADTSPFNNNDIISYTFQVGDTLASDSTYYYRLRSGNGTLWSSWSTTRSFSIDTNLTLSQWYQTQSGQFELNTLGLGVTIFTSQNNVGVNSQGDSSGWKYSQPITINNPGSVTVNQETLLSIDTASLISANKLQSDCDDLRFFDNSGATVNYFIESGCNTASTQIWLQIPNFATGDNIINMYYGNSTALRGALAWTGKFTVPSTTSCPSGWETNSNLLNRFPYGSAVYGVEGGAATHKHSDIPLNFISTNGTTTYYNATNGTTHASTRNHNHSANIPVQTSNHLPPYQTVNYCQSSNLSLSPGQMVLLASDTPANWTHNSSLDGYFPYGSTTLGITGGNSTHTHITTQSTTSQAYDVLLVGSPSGITYSPQHSHSVPSTSSSSASNIPPYVNLNFSSPDSQSIAPPGSIVITTSLPPLGFTRYTNLDNRIPFPSSTNLGSQGGSATHNHSFSFTTGSSTAATYAASGTRSALIGSHSHSTTADSDYSSNLPPYLSVVFAQKKTLSFNYSVGSETAITGFSAITSKLITGTDLDSRASHWHSLIFSDDETHGDIKYSLYYDLGGETIPIPDTDLPGNAAGFDTSPVNLTSLSFADYPQIYLSAQLQYQGGTPYLNDWTITVDSYPNTPSLSSPQNNATNLSLTPTFLTTASDLNNDYLRYKIEICSDLAMTQNCLTYDQSTSQVGWSGQNTQSNTAYSSGIQANFTPSTPLSPATAYYWRTYAIDPSGTNYWSQTQTPPRSFTTASLPEKPSNCLVDETLADSLLLIKWQDNASDENNYQIWRSVNGSDPALVLPALSAGTTAYQDATTQGSTYQYKIRATKNTTDGAIVYSDFCSTATLNLQSGSLYLDGVNLDGLNIN